MLLPPVPSPRVKSPPVKQFRIYGKAIHFIISHLGKFTFRDMGHAIPKCFYLAAWSFWWFCGKQNLGSRIIFHGPRRNLAFCGMCWAEGKQKDEKYSINQANLTYSISLSCAGEIPLFPTLCRSVRLLLAQVWVFGITDGFCPSPNASHIATFITHWLPTRDLCSRIFGLVLLKIGFRRSTNLDKVLDSLGHNLTEEANFDPSKVSSALAYVKVYLCKRRFRI